MKTMARWMRRKTKWSQKMKRSRVYNGAVRQNVFKKAKTPNALITWGILNFRKLAFFNGK